MSDRRWIGRTASVAVALTLSACGSNGVSQEGSVAPHNAAVVSHSAPTRIKHYHSAPNGLIRFVRTQFRRADRNHDGRLSRVEFDASIIKDFKAMDLNRDGVVTIADIQLDLKHAHAGKANRPLPFYLPYDTNGDGRITQREYLRTITRTIMRPMDANHDGKISLREAINWHVAELHQAQRRNGPR